MDVNKQVLYARNEKNEVIARQLIAISEEKKLVCFEVYPIGVDKEIKSIFRDYDVNFAKELKIDLTTNGEYTIENILSENWWDDYAWDLT